MSGNKLATLIAYIILVTSITACNTLTHQSDQQEQEYWENHFSDSDVGCTDDCLDTMFPQTDEYTVILKK